MSQKRRYQLLCPIGRALDVVGDRWALLILRDLHAGPARFVELQEGLGMATNLLTIRLVELRNAGLIHRVDESRRSAYALTELGRRTDRLLWELARFGGLIDRDPEPRKPGNLRTLALPLRILIESGNDRPDMVVRLLIDDDTFTIVSSPDGVDVEYGESSTVADLVARTSYEAFLDLGEGIMPPEQFAADHLEFIDGAEHATAFFALMGGAFATEV
jgi:DNA-binding HxlR family transcriptional regulator